MITFEREFYVHLGNKSALFAYVKPIIVFDNYTRSLILSVNKKRTAF